MSGNARRNFERMFPGIKEDEDRHLRTTLAQGRAAADRELQQKHNELTSNIEWELIWIFVYDLENSTEEYIPTTKKENTEEN